MNEICKLDNAVKHYAWGSPEWIPRLTGEENPRRTPWAELWMGVHPEGPSTARVQGRAVPLSELAQIPFLLKFLAAENPLSIQAHPNLGQAREGFELENKAGIALSAPERNYRDPNHKPEILCALSPFTAMAGFREAAETEQLLSMVPGTEKLRNALNGGYRSFLSVLFGLDSEERKKLVHELTQKEKRVHGLHELTRREQKALRLCGEFAKLYPNDPGILSPLYLNVIELKPFEAMFIPAGILHAYIHGFALECMANSDNVLRGGLTPKHVDTEELFSILNFEPFKPELITPIFTAPGCYGYTTPCAEFSLHLVKTTPGEPAVELEASGDAIIAVFEGEAEISSVRKGNIEKGDTGQGEIAEHVHLKRGESAFAGRREPGESLAFTGDCTLFAAIAPLTAAPPAMTPLPQVEAFTAEHQKLPQ